MLIDSVPRRIPPETEETNDRLMANRQRLVPPGADRENVMKISDDPHSSKPGAINNKNPLGILLALAFFAGTPLYLGEESPPFARPKTAKDSPSSKGQVKQ